MSEGLRNVVKVRSVTINQEKVAIKADETGTGYTAPIQVQLVGTDAAGKPAVQDGTITLSGNTESAHTIQLKMDAEYLLNADSVRFHNSSAKITSKDSKDGKPISLLYPGKYNGPEPYVADLSIQKNDVKAIQNAVLRTLNENPEITLTVVPNGAQKDKKAGLNTKPLPIADTTTVDPAGTVSPLATGAVTGSVRGK